MAKFLSTAGLSYRLEGIIQNANERLFIISPFLKINERIKALLEDKDRMKIDIRVVYRENELQPKEKNWLESMASIRTSFLKNLHAKCYLNENEALLTSMNLYEFSQQNNYEMGIIVSRGKDPELYNEIRKESDGIIRISEESPVTVASIEATEENKGHSAAKNPRRKTRKTRPTLKTPKDGLCIRCKAVLPADPTQPYCKRCYTSWKRYENPEYTENHCHTCGKEYAATLLKPMCRTCFKKYKDFFEFAA